MIENLRDTNVENKHDHTGQSTDPPLSVYYSDSWLQEQDITAFDFPYIRPMLVQSFNEWLRQSESLPFVQQASIALFDHEGNLAASSGEQTGADSGLPWDEQAVASCLAAKAPVIWKGGRHSRVDLHSYATILVPVMTRSGAELFALFACRIPLQSFEAYMPELLTNGSLHFRNCFYRRFELVFIRDVMRLQRQADEAARKKTILFNAVQKIHGTIDVDSVLTEVIDSIAHIYPTVQLELYISQDQRSTNIHVKPLRFRNSKDDLRVRAFMEGKVVQETVIGKNDSALLKIAVPLSGKQGAYGVLLLTAEEQLLGDLDIQLITMLADTAGTAFENAKLHEQANLLISELRLINELTKRLNQSLSLHEIFNFATYELLTIFKADYCCILQLDKDKNNFKVMACNLATISKELFTLDYGFGGLIYSTKEPIILPDYRAQSKVRSMLMDETESRSLIATPLVVNSEVNGAILLSHRESNYFSYDNFKLLQTLSAHIGVAIANASLHAKVQLMANRDNLTGLYARHYLDGQINQKQKIDFCGSLVVIDIDHFKQINDTYGHQVGDKILKQVCDIIRTAIRETDIAARWGGEELAVYFPQLNAQQTLHAAERIRSRVAEETEPGVTVSCGIADWNWEDEKVSVESLFYKADMALYRAKKNGRNQIKIH